MRRSGKGGRALSRVSAGAQNMNNMRYRTSMRTHGFTVSEGGRTLVTDNQAALKSHSAPQPIFSLVSTRFDSTRRSILQNQDGLL